MGFTKPAKRSTAHLATYRKIQELSADREQHIPEKEELPFSSVYVVE